MQWCSESVVLDSLGLNYSDLHPGEALFVDKRVRFIYSNGAKHELVPCIFEHVYFARPIHDGQYFGLQMPPANGRKARRKLVLKNLITILMWLSRFRIPVVYPLRPWLKRWA